MTTIRRKPADDHLLAFCWCGRVSAYIPAQDVRDGKTFLCSSACWGYYLARGVRFPKTLTDVEADAIHPDDSPEPGTVNL